jgi:hypothetical protein
VKPLPGLGWINQTICARHSRPAVRSRNSVISRTGSEENRFVMWIFDPLEKGLDYSDHRSPSVDLYFNWIITLHYTNMSYNNNNTPIVEHIITTYKLICMFFIYLRSIISLYKSTAFRTWQPVRRIRAWETRGIWNRRRQYINTWQGMKLLKFIVLWTPRLSGPDLSGPIIMQWTSPCCNFIPCLVSYFSAK